MHREASEFVRRAAELIGPVGTVCEFGSLNVNGSARVHFADDVVWVGFDKREGPGVDEVVDLESDGLLFEDFDLAVCCETLEHIRRADRVFDYLVGAVRPGGWVLVTVATEPREPHGCDGGPVGREWYRNIAPWELVRENLESVLLEVYPDRGDLYLLGRRCA